MSVIDLLGIVIMSLGAGFLLLAGLGLYRMPDTFTRLQAGTKATTLGTILMAVGGAIIMPEWTLKLGLIAAFLMFTSPLSSQILARSAHRAGLRASSQPDADALASKMEGKA